MADDEVLEGTKWIRFRFRPAPKTRWSCRGISYSSLDMIGLQKHVEEKRYSQGNKRGLLTPPKFANAPHC